MQENQEKNPLEKLYDELPKNVQEAISSVAVAEKIQEIAKKNGLHIDEAGVVSDEATMVMLGIEHPNDFVDGLKNKLKLPQEKIVALAKDVDKEIFEPIKESLMKIYQDQEIADEEETDQRGLNADFSGNKIKNNETIERQGNESIIPINDDGSIRLGIDNSRDQKKENTNTERLGNNILVPNNLPVEKKPDLIPINDLNKKDSELKKFSSENFSPEHSGKPDVLEEDAIFQSKTGNIVNLPREETVVEQDSSAGPRPVVLGTENKIKHIDPYREPTE